MKYLILLALFLVPSLAFANECPICRCTAIERSPEWIPIHDGWWACNVSLHEQQREYARCIGGIRELESRLSKKARKKYLPFVENLGIFNYSFPQHPTEDRINQIPESQAELDACEAQLGADFLPEVLRCSDHLRRLRLLK